MGSFLELPETYRKMEPEELAHRIRKRREDLGKRMVLLAHHYQRKEIVRLGDFIGDSYDLSSRAAAQKDAEFIVFCGVHFMAEAADILSRDSQRVFLPNPYAGCPMADMAPNAQVLRAWEELTSVVGAGKVLPVSYMNSSADLKAFCGRNGGLICTSSNAEKAFDYVFARAEKLFFFPDQHLGRNTANRKGIDRGRVIVWNPRKPFGGHTPETLRNARLILWQGHCHVHMNYSLEQVEARRREFPGVKIIVHPECREEVVDAADAAGSTKRIVTYVAQQPPGTAVAIGTELNLVARLIEDHPDKRIMALSPDTCPICVNMFRTTLNDLAFTLDAMEAGGANEIRVPEPVRSEARVALARMLELE